MPNRFPFNTPEHPEDNRSINKAFDRNYGNRLKSGDTTPLKYTIKDGDGEPLDKERLPNMQTSLILKYEGVTAYKTEFEAALEEVTENYVGDLVARFRIDEALPPSDTPYVVEFHFEDDEDLFIFPSVNTLELYITPSALNSDEEAIKSISDQRLNEIIERKLEENPVLSEAEAKELARQENYQELLDTGVMQTKINERLEDLEEEYAPKLTEVTAQLAQTRNQMILTPDHFDGTDGQKIQQALDYAISEDEHFISLNRTYDLTGETVFMPTEEFWGRVVFRGGKIIKNDVGFMFDRTGYTRLTHAPQFDGTLFESNVDGVYVFNGEGLLRFEMNSCKFTRVGLVLTTKYIQTLRLHQCETELLGCHFIHANNGYDIEISHHRGEQSSSDYQFLKMVTNTPNGISYFGLRILSSLIEGYTRTHPIEIGAGYGLSIKDNYFEKNMGSIRIVKGNGTTRLQGVIEGNVFADNLGVYDVFVDTSLFAQRLTLKNNTATNGTGGKYLVNRVFGTKNDMETNNLPMLHNVSYYPENLEAVEVNTSYAVTKRDLPDATRGVVFDIQLQQTSLPNYNSLQYLVNIKGQYGSSSIYRGHLTGILTIDIHQVDGSAQAELHFDILSTRNTHGSASGNLNAEPVYDYYFKETGTKYNAYNSNNNIVCIEMPTFVNQSRTTCTFKSLESLLQQQIVKG